MNNKNSERIQRNVTIALFIALAYVCTLIFRIKVGFLTFDLKDAIIVTGGLFFGPVAGPVIALACAFLELPVSETGLYGFIMNFASSAVLSLVPSLMYKYRRNIRSAIGGLALGVVSMVAVMLALNMLVTPYFMGQPLSAVLSMIPTLILPFNIIKGVVNASLVLVIYKPISRIMTRCRVIRHDSDKRMNHAMWAVITVVSLAVAVGCVLLCVFVFDASFEFVKRGVK